MPLPWSSYYSKYFLQGEGLELQMIYKKRRNKNVTVLEVPGYSFLSVEWLLELLRLTPFSLKEEHVNWQRSLFLEAALACGFVKCSSQDHGIPALGLTCRTTRGSPLLLPGHAFSGLYRTSFQLNWVGIYWPQGALTLGNIRKSARFLFHDHPLCHCPFSPPTASSSSILFLLVNKQFLGT